MKSFTTGAFRGFFNALPGDIQSLTRQKFDLWKKDPFHGKLNFKCVDKENEIWSVTINLQYRALGQLDGDLIDYMALDWYAHGL